MKELMLQLKDNILVPFSIEDQEILREFKNNQILKSKLSGTTKKRSLTQLNLYWKVCSIMAELLSDHNNIWDKADIDFEVKIRAAKKKPALIKRFKSVAGVVYLEPISTSFANMKHLEACNFYNIALSEMAEMAKMTVEDLVVLAKSKMRPK